MAVQLVTKINRYIGTAAEIAALTLTGIPVGSTFFEADTGILKTLSAAGTLVVAPSETVALAAGTALAGKFVPADTDGDEKFTAANPAVMQLSGSKVGKGITSSFTRANATEAYQAGDVIADSASAGTVPKFANVGAAGDEIMILGVTALFKKAATALSIPSGMTTFTLHLYNAAPTAINDNVAWALPYADADKYLGSIKTMVIVDKGDVLWSDKTGINKAVKLSGTDLYYILVTDGGFTPTAEVVKAFTLYAMAI